MDHHCPWVNNCIGFYNKKFFIQLICYFFLCSLFYAITYLPYSVGIIQNIAKYYGKEELNLKLKDYLILLNNLLLIAFTLIDFNFMKFHFKLIKSNLTTIETLDNELMENHKYDIGFLNNFMQIFGENKLFWFLPINFPSGYPIGDGLSWVTKDDFIPMTNVNEGNKNGENTLEHNYTNEKIAEKNKDSIVNVGKTLNSSNIDYSTNKKDVYGKYSKYNSVKRNHGNYNSNSTGISSKYNNEYNKNNDSLIK